MNEASITQYISNTFSDVDVVTVEATGDTFFCCDPDHMIYFATLLTNSSYDQFSDLGRPSVFRLNIGIGKESYNSLFGPRPTPSNPDGVGDIDYTALDRLMPHPEYARMHWVCILNPSDEKFQRVVQPLLVEAYEMAASKHSKREARKSE